MSNERIHNCMGMAVTVLVVAIILFFIVADFARGITWIKWAFSH